MGDGRPCPDAHNSDSGLTYQAGTGEMKGGIRALAERLLCTRVLFRRQP